MHKKIIRRCCICKAVEIDGKVIPLSDYDPAFLEKLGYSFTDTYLSLRCTSQFYAKDERNPRFSDEIRRLYSGLRYESCD